MVKIGNTTMGVYANGDEVFFNAPVEGVKYAKCVDTNDKGTAPTGSVTSVGTTGKYVVNSSDATSGVIDLIQVAEVQITGITVTFGTSGSETTNNVLIKIGTNLALNETSYINDAKHIQVNGVNVGTPSAAPSAPASGTYEIKGTDATLTIAMES